MYCLLDETPLWNVQATTLSKILHRKRPRSIVLHDRWVWKCYIGTGAVPHAESRSWAAYMVLMSLAIRDDLRNQSDQFAALARSSSGAASLTAVRLLDILAWRSQGETPKIDEPEAGDRLIDPSST